MDYFRELLVECSDEINNMPIQQKILLLHIEQVKESVNVTKLEKFPGAGNSDDIVPNIKQ